MIGAPRRLGLVLFIRLLLSAFLTSLAFPPFHWGPIILVALVPFFDAVRLAEAAPPAARRRASAMLYAGGVVHFALLLYWILFLPPEEMTTPALLPLAFLLLCGYLGLFIFAATAIARRGMRLGMPLGVALPVAWVAAEYLRSLTQLAFPWALVGYGLIEKPVILQFLSLTGIFGGSLFVMSVNGLVHSALVARGRRRWIASALALLLVSLVYLHGLWSIRHLPPAATAEVVLVQGNIGREIKFKPEYRLRNVDRMIALSEEAMIGPGRRPDLVVWPETATPCYLGLDAPCLNRLTTFVDRVGVPLLTGVPDIDSGPDGSERSWNAAVLIAPHRGIVARYAKVNLVPFGEALPYQDRWPALAAINFGEADFHRGPGFIPIESEGRAFGVMICFESIFPGVGRTYAREGATFFVNITNDEWFGPSGGPYQHAAMAVARAIENRRGLARAANTGVTMVIDRAGRVSHATGLFTEGVVRAPVELGSGTTVYMRIGDLVPLSCVAASAAIVAAAWRARKRDSGNSVSRRRV